MNHPHLINANVKMLTIVDKCECENVDDRYTYSTSTERDSYIDTFCTRAIVSFNSFIID